MSSVDPWAPTFDFENDEEPLNLINAAALQGQLNLLASAQADLYAALAAIQGDDDTLVDALVRIRNLHPELSTYIESNVTGSALTQSLTYRKTVRLAATLNVTLSAPQTIDGVAAIADDEVILPFQTDEAENGIWVVAAGAWTRRSELPAGDAVGSGWAVIVREGTSYAHTAWMPVTGGDDTGIVGTDDIEFMQVFAPFPLPVARGGTGAITAADAATNLGFARKEVNLATVIGDGTTTLFVVPHSLGVNDTIVSVRAAVDDLEVMCDQNKSSSASVTLTFATAPAAGVTYVVTIEG